MKLLSAARLPKSEIRYSLLLPSGKMEPNQPQLQNLENDRGTSAVSAPPLIDRFLGAVSRVPENLTMERAMLGTFYLLRGRTAATRVFLAVLLCVGVAGACHWYTDRRLDQELTRRKILEAEASIRERAAAARRTDVETARALFELTKAAGTPGRVIISSDGTARVESLNTAVEPATTDNGP